MCVSVFIVWYFYFVRNPAPAQRKPWPEASGCCRDVEQHGSAAAKPCWASLLETDEQNTEHAENANTNMGKCDDYTISPEKLLGQVT